jgi:hypothetical protein
MAAPATKYGYKSKDYHNSGSYGTPTWGAVDQMESSTVVIEHDQNPASARQGGVHADEPGMVRITVNMRIRKDYSDAKFLALMTAMKNKAAIDMMFLDDALTVNGATGTRANGKLHGWEEPRGLGDTLYITTTFRGCVTDPAEPASHVVVTSGAPVFTAM